MASSRTYNAANTSVWWDMEECELPKGFVVDVIINNIKTALMKANYGGSISFSVYADTDRLPSLVRKAFERTGVSVNHVPAGPKDDRDKKILVDMMIWAVDNPAPANFLLISGDQKDFWDELEQFNLRGYNILLAHPRHASLTKRTRRSSDALFPGAKSVWDWASLFSGGFPIASAANSCQDASRVNQTALPEPERPPAAQPMWAPHLLFQNSKPEIPAIPIPHYSDMLEDIQSFNDRLIRQRNIKFNEPEKLFSFKNRYEEECQPVSEYKSTGVCNALHYLQDEMMLPTKENIQNVIRYGDRGDSNLDVEEALSFELEHDMIVTQKLGNLSLYLPRNCDLWNCVNPEGGRADQYPKATWDSIENYLMSLDGRVQIMTSKCRYEACLKLRKGNSCLRSFPLGRVHQILNMIIAKEWIWVLHPGGWEAVCVTLPRRG